MQGPINLDHFNLLSQSPHRHARFPCNREPICTFGPLIPENIDGRPDHTQLLLSNLASRR